MQWEKWEKWKKSVSDSGFTEVNLLSANQVFYLDSMNEIQNSQQIASLVHIVNENKRKKYHTDLTNAPVQIFISVFLSTDREAPFGVTDFPIRFRMSSHSIVIFLSF